ncbi:Receptor-type tyrosine-protein phosphatase S [Liparis tanakae]|uniref:Receptor-type tyrosine-protein phosphatase S n=1 Tax=Liparis tanakae TaxID=230148 RepID=A0A4Z2EQY0_9TELE|nr:Receptor-type tyrosine-protein phosphatase S [Liparis tanakae]
MMSSERPGHGVRRRRLFEGAAESAPPPGRGVSASSWARSQRLLLGEESAPPPGRGSQRDSRSGAASGGAGAPEPCSRAPQDLLPPGFPNIDMGPQLKVVERTRTATMLCAASGNPDPEITWYKDFLPIDPSASNGRIKQLRSGKPRPRTALCPIRGFEKNNRRVDRVHTDHEAPRPG